jgi:serine/threonine-protein kinase HipA
MGQALGRVHAEGRDWRASCHGGLDGKRIPHRSYSLALSAGAKPHYEILDLHGRHFVETAKAAGLGPTVIRQVIDEVRAGAIGAAEQARSKMPPEFPDAVHHSVAAAIQARLPRLDTADDAI